MARLSPRAAPRHLVSTPRAPPPCVCVTHGGCCLAPMPARLPLAAAACAAGLRPPQKRPAAWEASVGGVLSFYYFSNPPLGRSPLVVSPVCVALYRCVSCGIFRGAWLFGVVTRARCRGARVVLRGFVVLPLFAQGQHYVSCTTRGGGSVSLITPLRPRARPLSPIPRPLSLSRHAT
jgi:hypothetical protein